MLLKTRYAFRDGFLLPYTLKSAMSVLTRVSAVRCHFLNDATARTGPSPLQWLTSIYPCPLLVSIVLQLCIAS